MGRWLYSFGREESENKIQTKAPGCLGIGRVLSGSDARRFLDLYAENRTADRPAIEPKEEKIKRNQQPMESDTTGDNISLVGPSAEEIHDFLYPTREDDKVLTRAN